MITADYLPAEVLVPKELVAAVFERIAQFWVTPG